MTHRPVHDEDVAARQKPAAPGRRLTALIVPIAAAGVAAAAIAAWSFVAGEPTAQTLVEIALLLGGAIFAEAYPVQIESIPAGNVSLAAVFVVSAGLIYGWAAAALIALGTRTTLELVQRRPALKLVTNGAVYCLSGVGAGLAERLVPDRAGTLQLFAAVLLGASAFYVVNVLLIAAIVACVSGERVLGVIAQMAYWTVIPFAIMASVSLILYVLWERSPATAAALAGPLVAIVLYQRSVYRTVAATRLALTDELTGLGNTRHFHERVESDLDRAVAEAGAVTLCLVDLDDFKRINDTFGHLVGDQILSSVAAQLRNGGEAFRLGGDEFAILLYGHDDRSGLAVAEAVIERIRSVRCPDGSSVTVSAGVASFPDHGVDRTELRRIADRELYRAKREGKNVVRGGRSGVVELDSVRHGHLLLAERLALRLGVAEADVAAALSVESLAAGQLAS